MDVSRREAQKVEIFEAAQSFVEESDVPTMPTMTFLEMSKDLSKAAYRNTASGIVLDREEAVGAVYKILRDLRERYLNNEMVMPRSGVDAILNHVSRYEDHRIAVRDMIPDQEIVDSPGMAEVARTAAEMLGQEYDPEIVYQTVNDARIRVRGQVADKNVDSGVSVHETERATSPRVEAVKDREDRESGHDGGRSGGR